MMDCILCMIFLSVIKGVLSGAGDNCDCPFLMMVIVVHSWDENCGLDGILCWRQWRRFGIYPGILRSTYPSL